MLAIASVDARERIGLTSKYMFESKGMYFAIFNIIMHNIMYGTAR